MYTIVAEALNKVCVLTKTEGYSVNYMSPATEQYSEPPMHYLIILTLKI